MTVSSLQLWALAGVMSLGFGASYLLPEVPPMRSSRLATDLPAKLGAWEGLKIPVSERERTVLAKDTRFERRLYHRPNGGSVPPVEASFVFSGKDMNNSIHRPEVCLRAQGWNFVRERYVSVPGVMPDGGAMPVREIVCKRTSIHPETGERIVLPDGSMMEDWQILFYTFIGSEEVTPSHYGRVFRDMRDRVVSGYDQQWAYATFSSRIPGKYRDQGIPIGEIEALDEDGTSRHLGEFMRELLPAMLSAPPHS